MLQPPGPPSPKRSWTSVAASTTLHVALIALALVLSRQPESADPRPQSSPSDAPRRVEMVYLPPPPTPPPAETPPPPQPPAPTEPVPPTPPRTVAPPARQPIPEPRANAPPEATRAEGEEAPAEAKSPAGEPVPEAAPTLESEARRIFGRRRPRTPPGAGPVATRPMEAYAPDQPEECIPRQPELSDSAGPVELGTVVGRIFRQDNGRPLAGAHLQMVGTPYVSFTDDDGEYRFRFDLSLVDQCRTQYVRVTASGFESRLLVLLVGADIRSEDVLLRKR